MHDGRARVNPVNCRNNATAQAGVPIRPRATSIDAPACAGVLALCVAIALAAVPECGDSPERSSRGVWMRTAIFLLAALTAAPALAQDGFSYFRSPSDNIHCAIMDLDDYKGVRCDLRDAMITYPRPKDCDLDWGDAFEVADTGKGAPLCAGDTVEVPDARVLQYGETISRAGLSCTSRRSGMTCKNAEGHGFTVSRGGQKVF